MNDQNFGRSLKRDPEDAPAVTAFVIQERSARYFLGGEKMHFKISRLMKMLWGRLL